MLSNFATESTHFLNVNNGDENVRFQQSSFIYDYATNWNCQRVIKSWRTSVLTRNDSSSPNSFLQNTKKEIFCQVRFLTQEWCQVKWNWHFQNFCTSSTNQSEINTVKSKAILEVAKAFKNYKNIIQILMVWWFYLDFSHLVHLGFFGGTKVEKFE